MLKTRDSNFSNPPGTKDIHINFTGQRYQTVKIWLTNVHQMEVNDILNTSSVWNGLTTQLINVNGPYAKGGQLSAFSEISEQR